MTTKYEPYQPTKWEKRIDALFGLVSTNAAVKRMVNREKLNWFRYLAAQPTGARRNAPYTTAGEWLKVQREKLQIMWNAIMMVDNSGLCTGILHKFPTYVCGTLSWQARTGDKATNDAYEDYIKQKCGKPSNIDMSRRYTLRQMCMLDVKSIALKGDVGTNIVRIDDELYLQGIEADRIGDPYRWVTNQNYVRGLDLDDYGAITGVHVFHQDRLTGYYKFDDVYSMHTSKGLPNFLFFTNPIDYDNYRGVSLFKHAIDNSTYIDRMRQYELQALLWAASQSGVYYTRSGGLPEQLPFDRQPYIDEQGNSINVMQARPNTISALSADGEKVEMFQHDRPSPNVIGMYENTVRDIAIGAGLTYGFCYNMTGLTGPAVRQCSAQDARAIQIWQEMLREQKLDQVIMLFLGDAIAKGDLPYHKNWLRWEWFFPAKPTIDVGRESQANIEELEAGINTGANIVAEGGLGDIGEVITQRSNEIKMMIEAAQNVGKELDLPWEQVYALMIPPQRGKGGGGFGAAAGAAGAMVGAGMNRDAAGASSNGADLNGDGGNGNGSRYSLPHIVQNFYDPSQARDDHGRWTDEGGGAGGGGGSVSGGSGGGVAVAERTAKAAPSQAPAKADPWAEWTPLDKKLIDYKPKERSLTDPEKTVEIDKYLPSIRKTPYTKTDFFNQVSAMQGTPDPGKVTGEQYKTARDSLFDKLPVASVPLDNVVGTQPVVNTDKITAIGAKEKAGIKFDPIQAVRYRGETYILNGHHRAVMQAKRGDKMTEAHVLDLDDQLPNQQAIDTYVKAVKAKPELDNLVTGVVNSGVGTGASARAKLAMLKNYDGRGGALAKVNAPPSEGSGGGYGGDWSKIKDIPRARIVTEDAEGMRNVAAEISKRLGYGDLDAAVQNKQVKFTKSKLFADYKFNPVVKGINAEISVTTKGIDTAGERNHPHYKESQEIQRNANNEGRAMTESEHARVKELDDKMEREMAPNLVGV